jgi:predicted negative regulator of RcsB-dependent stress response
VGTTKLTRKEIIADDPVRDAILRLIEFLQENRKWIGIGIAAFIVVGLGAYLGMSFLGAREIEAQQQLTKGMEIYHAPISSDEASDNDASEADASEAGAPEAGTLETGAEETPETEATLEFGSEKEKYEAAAKEFSAVASRRGQAKTSLIARYYLGLTQLKLERNEEAIESLKAVADNSRNRALGFLAQNALATHYLDSENFYEAGRILQLMLEDPQCDLPKDDLSLRLSRALVAQDRQDEAIAILTDANSQDVIQGPYRQQVMEELQRLNRAAQKSAEAKAKPEQESASP